MGEGVRGISSHIAADVVKSGAPVVTTDAQVDPRYNKNESVAMHSIRAVMCVPLRSEEQGPANDRRDLRRPPAGLRLFDDRGVGFLSGFASHAAAAIEGARLAQRSAEETKTPRTALALPQRAGDRADRGQRRCAAAARDHRALHRRARIHHDPGAVEPEEAVEMLDDYFGEIAEEVFAAEGTLDKFTGDGLMAFWNAPALQPDHALRAVRAALRMQTRLPAMLARWRREKRSFLRWVEDLPTGSASTPALRSSARSDRRSGRSSPQSATR